MEISIKPLTKHLKEDYLFLFDNIEFDENPDRLSCYCNDYHFLGDVDSCTRSMSRELIIERIDKSELRGYLAFDDDKAIGWCNVNDRANYQRLLRDYKPVDNPNDKACSIVCFLIHPDFRRKGIARKLLERIIEDYSSQDFDYFEAYPRKEASSNEANFKGPIELYKEFGFKIHKEHDIYYAVRKSIDE